MFWVQCLEISYIIPATCHLPESNHLVPEVLTRKRGHWDERLQGICLTSCTCQWLLGPGLEPRPSACLQDPCSRSPCWVPSWYKYVAPDHVSLSAFSYQMGLFLREEISYTFVKRKRTGFSKWVFLLNLVRNLLKKLIFFIGKIHFLCGRAICRVINVHWLASEAPGMGIRTRRYEVCFPLHRYPALLWLLLSLIMRNDLVWWMDQLKPGSSHQRTKAPSKVFPWRCCCLGVVLISLYGRSEDIISEEASDPNLLILLYFAFGSMSNAHTNIIFWVMGNLEMYDYGRLAVELIK